MIDINMRGGKRKGAGRKKGFAAKSAEEARCLLAQRVAEEIGSLCDVLVSKAKGGDMRAMHELLDRAWGRAPQAVFVSAQETHRTHSNDQLRIALRYEEELKKMLDDTNPKA